MLAYLLKTQLSFLQTASEHILDVLHTDYSGKTMLELLGGEAFFLAPSRPAQPTETCTQAAEASKASCAGGATNAKVKDSMKTSTTTMESSQTESDSAVSVSTSGNIALVACLT